MAQKLMLASRKSPEWLAPSWWPIVCLCCSPMMLAKWWLPHMLDGVA
jgi:hypothetical protein